MMPEILGVPVSAHHMQQRPASYSTFSDHAAQVRTNAAVRKTKPRPGRSRSSDNIDIGAGTSEAVSMETGGQKQRRRRARRRHKKSGSMEVEITENSASVTGEDRVGDVVSSFETRADMVGDVVSSLENKSDGEEAGDSMVVTPVIAT